MSKVANGYITIIDLNDGIKYDIQVSSANAVINDTTGIVTYSCIGYLNQLRGSISSPVSNTLIYLYANDKQIDEVTTDSTGKFNFTEMSVQASGANTLLLKVYKDNNLNSDLLASYSIPLSHTQNNSYTFFKYSNDNGTTFTAPSQAALDEVQAGLPLEGRNLFQGTRDFKYGNYGGTLTANDYLGFTSSSRSYPISGYSDHIHWDNIIAPTPNTYYTLSFYAKSTNAGDSIVSYFYPNTQDGVADGSTTSILTDTWKKYIIVWHTSDSVSGVKNVIVCRLHTGRGSGTVSACGIKLEVGDTATPWTPAPEECTFGTTKGRYLGKLAWDKPYPSSDPTDYTWIDMQGTSGGDATTVSLSKDSIVFTANDSGYVDTAQSITVTVSGYKGSTQVATTIGTITGTATGLTTSITNNNTTSATIKISAATTLNTKSGILTIPITANGITINKQFSWALTEKGTIIPQIYVYTNPRTVRYSTNNTGIIDQTVLNTIPYIDILANVDGNTVNASLNAYEVDGCTASPSGDASITVTGIDTDSTTGYTRTRSNIHCTVAVPTSIGSVDREIDIPIYVDINSVTSKLVVSNNSILGEVSGLKTTVEDNSDYIASLPSILGDLQDQVDGEIDNWFYEDAPTTTNLPASTWTTDTLKDRHLGDTYTCIAAYPDANAGKSWRWIKNTSGVYTWREIADSDAVKALVAASTAQSTADGKRRIFTATPTVPYDVGDLWVAGSAGDIKYCKTAKTSSQTYLSTDWVLASKYTDNTVANSAMAKITEITSDDKLSPDEKPQELSRFNDVVNEKQGITSQGTLYGLTAETTAYTNAYSALTTYLNNGANLPNGSTPSFFSNLTVSTNITGSTYRKVWNDYYVARQNLLNAIYTKANTLANNAQTSANSAIASIERLANDDIISAVEKPALLRQWQEIQAKEAKIFELCQDLKNRGGINVFLDDLSDVYEELETFIGNNLDSTNDDWILGSNGGATLKSYISQWYTEYENVYGDLYYNNNTLQNQYTDGKIEVTNTRINSKVSLTEYNSNKTTVNQQITSITQTANDIQYTVQSGSNNLIFASDFLDSNNLPSLMGDSEVLTTSQKDGHNVVHAPATTSTNVRYSGFMYYLDSSQVVTGNTYTFSVAVKIANTSAASMIAMEAFSNTSDNTRGAKINSAIYQPSLFTSGTWKRIFLTFTKPQAAPYNEVNVWIEHKGEAWFAEPKLELGNLATEWTPAVDEYRSLIKQTSNSILLEVKNNLSSTGINIDIGTITTTADNFTVLNNSGETTFGVDADGNSTFRGIIHADYMTKKYSEVHTDYVNTNPYYGKYLTMADQMPDDIMLVVTGATAAPGLDILYLPYAGDCEGRVIELHGENYNVMTGGTYKDTIITAQAVAGYVDQTSPVVSYSENQNPAFRLCGSHDFTRIKLKTYSTTLGQSYIKLMAIKDGTKYKWLVLQMINVELLVD